MRTVVAVLVAAGLAVAVGHTNAATINAAATGLGVLTVPTAVLPVLDALASAPPRGDTEAWSFSKVYRRRIPREMVWFNGREGDLEHHAIRYRGRVYITLTDLVRNVGGSIVWGPRASYVVVKRAQLTVRVVPGSSKVFVEGEPDSLGAKTFRRGGLLWVPVRPMAELLGCVAEWNPEMRRVDVFM
ncbi:MAG: copper amine oxidase N-terminal domain-containing protein [Armatimonadetes bacterium]|nr:copper amine oxidase N-terminal domain-containing protein [Armatimonadota bacterium]